ncbi:hypothetical protein [uncultured Thiodictyon sp.]|uniref:hypothetical protein n=1 Tax=uncultured Thiodictyon sp. TaxID=1846217 RepID=UPI0025D4D712|nr:hypothetical protein [uncultured Thiodictyon sp.]
MSDLSLTNHMINFRASILIPGLDKLAAIDGPPRTTPAETIMLTIAAQESGFASRYQKLTGDTPGPARGWWQFEQKGGVQGVMHHSATQMAAAAICITYAVAFQSGAIWRALEGHDGLATAFARLLLFTDPQPLPTTPDAAWNYYLRNWRPGKPHRATWAANWDAAIAATT